MATSVPMAGVWELVVDRLFQERRGDEWRTVGTYATRCDRIRSPALAGWMVECGGPGDNDRKGNRRRLRAGRYPLMIQAGDHYRTFGYGDRVEPDAWPLPGILLGDTGARVAIVVHPGHGFVSSEGCLNPAGRLSDRDQDIDFADSRRRTIALIDDLRAHLGYDFPNRANATIPGAWISIQGEP